MIPQYRVTLLEERERQNTPMTSRTFKIDWESNRLLTQHIDGSDAVGQAIQVISCIEWKDWEIMPEWFGFEIRQYYGMARPFVKANLERLIKEACSTDDRIKRLSDFTFEDLDHAILVRFKVELDEQMFLTEVEVENV